MNDKQIREIVKITLDELTARGMLNDSYREICKQVEKRLINYFISDKPDMALSSALSELCDDLYIDIIYAQYRDGKTLEWLAEYYERDVSTIKRNKKRLIKTIYEMARDV